MLTWPNADAAARFRNPPSSYCSSTVFICCIALLLFTSYFDLHIRCIILKELCVIVLVFYDVTQCFID
jgi:hypothetical protein